MAQLAKRFSWTWIGTISSDDEYGRLATQTFAEELLEANVCMAFSETVSKIYPRQDALRIVNIIKKSLARVIVVFSGDMDVEPLFLELAEQNITNRQFLASEAWSNSPVLSNKEISAVTRGVLGIAIQKAEIPGLWDFLVSLHPSKFPGNTFVERLWEESFNCRLALENVTLLYYMTKVHFRTKVGDQVYFDENGDPIAAYDIINWQMSKSGILEFINVGHINGSELYINDTAIIWADGTKKRMQAMTFAIEEINKDEALLPNLTLGYRILDNCLNLQMSLRAALKHIGGLEDSASDYSCQGLPPVVAIIGDPVSSHSVAISRVLGLFGIPLVSYSASCSCLSSKKEYPSFFRTIPSDIFQVKVMVEIIKHFGWTWVGAVGSDDDYGRYALLSFNEEVNKFGCIAFSSTFTANEREKMLQIIHILKQSTAKVIVLFMLKSEATLFLNEIVSQNITGKQWIGSDSLSGFPGFAKNENFMFFGGTIGINAKRGLIPGFENHLLQIQPSMDGNNNLLNQFWETMFGCTFTNNNTMYSSAKLCTGKEDILNTKTAYSDVSELRTTYNAYKAVYALAYALHNLIFCESGKGPFENNACADIKKLQPWQLLHYLKTASFVTKSGDRVAFDKNGDVLPMYDILNWQRADDGSVVTKVVGVFDGSSTIGNELALNEDMMFWNFNHGKVPESVCSRSCPPGTRKATRKGEPICCFDCLPCADGEISSQSITSVFLDKIPHPCLTDEELPFLNSSITLARLKEVWTLWLHVRFWIWKGFYLSFDLSFFQRMEAMIFAIEEINKDEALLPNLTLGYQILDNCLNLQMSLRAALKHIGGLEDSASDYSCQGLPPVVAIIGDPVSSHSVAISRVLGLFGIPLVSYSASCSCLSNKQEYPSFFRTIPSDIFQVKVMVEIIKHFGWTWVGAVGSDDDYGRFDLPIFQRSQVLIFAIEEVNRSQRLLPNITLGYRLFDNCMNVQVALRAASMLIAGSDEIITTEDCRGLPPVVAIIGDPLSIHSVAISRTLGVYRFPLLLYYLKQVNFIDNLGERVAFDENGDALPTYDIINWQPAGDGTVISKTIGLYDYLATDGKQLLLKEDAIFWNFNPPTIPESVCSKSCMPGTRKATRKGQPVCCFDCVPCADGEISSETDAIECSQCSPDHWSNNGRNQCVLREIEYLSYEDAMGCTLTTTALFGTCLSISILAVFVLYRNTPVVKANNSELSFLLLIALTLCFLCALCFIGQPSDLTCRLRHVVFGISFVLCISCILVKTIVVIMAFKATLPGNNMMKWFGVTQQRGTVFFFTFIQALICIIWLATAPPFPAKNNKYQTAKIIYECDVGSVTGFGCLLGYIGLLAGISFVLAFLARNLPDTFNEAKFITFSMLIFCAVWITFIPAYISSPGKYTVAVEIFAILASSFGLLFAIFAPKCYIILLRPEQNTKKALMGRGNADK
ncbi:CASR protein, partial [Polypterus senegalus]